MKKIPVRTLYLLLVIGIGLIGLGIGSTYAIFTTSAEISNPITLNSSLSHVSDIIETIEVEVPAGETVSNTLNVTNSSGTTLNYTVWYLDEGKNIDVGTNSGTPIGTIGGGNSTSIVVDVRNNSDSKITVIFGISSNSGSVVLGSGMIAVSSDALPDYSNTIIDYITNLYVSGSPSLITQETSNDSYYYSYQDDTNTWGLMNDGLKVDNTLDATTTGLATTVTDTTALTSGTEGNIRYFGPSDNVNNYIYFNCSDYSNQSDSTCEKWRIIGIVDGKVKIIRNELTVNLAWDQDKNQDESLTTYNNNWKTSSLQEFLNGLYYNRGTIESHPYYSGSTGTTTTSLDLETIGITAATRNNNLISESIWYLGGYSTSDGLYPNDIYNYERQNKVGATIYSTNDFIINKNIGLMYASDYGYGTDLTKCSKDIYYYNTVSACITGNWLFNNKNQWLITPRSLGSRSALFVDSTGYVIYNYTVCTRSGVRPVLYLNSELGMESGHEGTSTDPYRISV